MNLQLTPLASISAHRLIAACPTGTLYLIWDNAILRLPPFGSRMRSRRPCAGATTASPIRPTAA
jgi:hypothetical protein